MKRSILNRSSMLMMLFVPLTLSLSSCKSANPGSVLRQATGVPAITSVPFNMTVKTHPMLDGVVALPAGEYKLLGENEKGVFYASPSGVGATIGIVTTTPSSVASGGMDIKNVGGVLIQRSGFTSQRALVYATWRGSLKSGAVVIRVVSPLKERLTLETH